MITPETEMDLRAVLKATGYDAELVDQLDHESLFDLGFHELMEAIKP